MRILFLSKEGDGLGVGQRLALEGHHVDFYVSDSRYERAGKGLVHRVPSWQSVSRRADLIVADGVGLGRYEDTVRRLGRPTLGLSKILDTIELDRAAGMRLFEQADITVPDTYEFSSRDEAMAVPHKEGFDDGWVVKPNGNKGSAKTIVCTREASWNSELATLPDPCSGILQRVVSGVEISTEGWFNGTKFIRPFNHTFEEKRFLNGGLGQNTGCAGNVVINAGAGNRLTRATVERVEPFLRLIGYHGPFDVNCIVNDKDAFALEATSRFGYDAVEALAEGLEQPLGEFLFDVAAGTAKDMKLTDETMIAVRLSIPPYPVQSPDRNAPPLTVHGIDDSTIYHLFLCDIEKRGSSYVTANGDGILLKATAVGRVDSRPGSRPDYTYDARRRVYRLLDKIDVGGKQYRTDIGARVNEDIEKLKKWGWLNA